MQRRKVDLPEPDGPIRHSTSPAPTSRLMPFSTSRRPKRLWTRSAMTIGGAAGTSSVAPARVPNEAAGAKAWSGVAHARGPTGAVVALR